MAVQCLIYFNRLKNKDEDKEFLLWKFAFISYSVSFFFGGLAHFLYAYSGQVGKLPGWLAGAFAVSFMGSALISKSTKIKAKKMLQNFLIGETIIFCVLTVITQNFMFIIMHTIFLIPYVLFLTSWHGLNIYTTFYLALAALATAALVRVAKLDIHLWFNRDDLAHVFVIIALWVFYKGSLMYDEKMELSTQEYN